MIRALALAASVLAAQACATSGAEHYRVALASQEQCCAGIADPGARRACLDEVPRTQDQTSQTNAETFQCVASNFQCDPATGRATRASAQTQLDCLNDLPSTPQAQ